MLKIFDRNRVDRVLEYADLDSARVISYGNVTRGLFMLRITDSLDANRPRVVEMMIKGGFSYTGEGRKYFILEQGQINVASITTNTSGHDYSVVDSFGNTYQILLDGRKDFNPTIERTAGSSLTGDIEIRVILWAYA